MSDTTHSFNESEEYIGRIKKKKKKISLKEKIPSEEIKEYFFCKSCHKYTQIESEHVLTFCNCEKLNWDNIENIIVFPGEKIEDKIKN